MRTRKLGIAAIAALAVGLPIAATSSASADTIRIQSTTDTIDAGLRDGLLVPAYAAAQPGDTLNYVGVGTGAALTNAENGLADVVITHAPSLEEQFVAGGYSLEPAGRAIFYSDYVIVGPQSDPAGVAARDPHDAVSAYEDIAAAGVAGTATFVSRNDNSGTNVEEQDIWGLTGSSVPKVLAANGRGDPARYTPTGSWYAPNSATTTSQATNVNNTSVCDRTTYPNGGCYTMVDRGTFNRLINAGLDTNLRIVSQNNTPDVRGGRDLLVNPFSVYIVNPNRVAGVNVAAAERFVSFITSQSFQAQVNGFPNSTEPAFHADAQPSVTLTSPLPATTAAGSTLTLAVSLANLIPGQLPPVAMPVQLQASTDGGTTWANVGLPLNTDASGNVTFTPTIAATTAYRVSTGDFQATTWSEFSAGTASLGAVTVPPIAVPTPLPTPPAAKDTVAPKVTKTVLDPRKVLLTINERSTVRVTVKLRVARTVKRKGHKRTVVTYRTVRSRTGKLTKAGTLTLKWPKALAAGTYHVDVRTTDAAHNTRVQTVTLKIKAAKKKTTTRGTR